MTTPATTGAATTAEPPERVVEEVHCVDCGAPMSSIPGWYAAVAVKFSCDACRQKSPRLAAAAALPAASTAAAAVDVEPRAAVPLDGADADADAEVDAGVEDVDLEAEADEIDVNLVDEEIGEPVEE